MTFGAGIFRNVDEACAYSMDSQESTECLLEGTFTQRLVPNWLNDCCATIRGHGGTITSSDGPLKLMNTSSRALLC